MFISINRPVCLITWLQVLADTCPSKSDAYMFIVTRLILTQHYVKALRIFMNKNRKFSKQIIPYHTSDHFYSKYSS